MWSKKNPPPDWFFEIYDSLLMNVPYFPSDDIRKVPLYVRWRIRTVHELKKNANITLAHKNKAWNVFDWSKFF